MSRSWLRSSRGIALFVATLGAALASLVALTAALLAERSIRNAAAWSAAVRVDAGVGTALDRALGTWPPAFGSGGGVPLGPIQDSVDLTALKLWLVPVSDSIASLVAEAAMTLGGGRASAGRLGTLLVRLVSDSTGPGVIGAVPAGTGWDRTTPIR